MNLLFMYGLFYPYQLWLLFENPKKLMLKISNIASLPDFDTYTLQINIKPVEKILN